MAEHPNVARIRRAYHAFLSGDLPTTLEQFAPDAVFHVAGDGPISGHHKGREAIGAALAGSYQITGGSQSFALAGIYADDEHGVVVTQETATRVSDGATLDIPEVHVMTFGPEGLIAEFWDIPEDHDVHDNFFAGR